MTEYGSDWGEADFDPEQQRQADVNLDQPNSVDDVPWSPPGRRPRGAQLVGIETGDGESIEQRILQEEPEIGTAYGAPNPDGEAEETEPDMLGGVDPLAIPADLDVLGETAPGDSGPFVAPDPEESAMHLVDEDDEPL